MSVTRQVADSAPAAIPAPADDLCLGFVNTRYWRGSPNPTETLSEPEDLRHWLEDSCGWRAIRWTNMNARAEFAAAIELREMMFRLFAAVATGQPCAQADLDRLNLGLAAAPLRQCLALEASRRGWVVAAMPRSVTGLLAPVLWSASDLLLGPRAARVRQCANPACEFLFLDDSKSGNRRWCSMSSCGNRAKAHRHYLRHKPL
jgi:predicted RNA-binding Zn ribbon-like protein